MNIYSQTETDFIHNGLGFLTDILNANITDNLNGEYSLFFEYKINGKLNEYLQNENIVKCEISDGTKQLFVIKNVVKTFNSIQVTAKHIFYQLLDNFLEDVAPANLGCQPFLQWILDRTNYTHNFTGYSDITNPKSARYVRRNPVDCILGNTDNSMVNLFGGELKRDNFDIHFNKKIGSDNGVKLIVGKNITGINITVDTNSVHTRIIPQGFDGLFLPEKYIDSPLINNYIKPKIYKVEFSDIKYDPEDENAYHNLNDAYEALRSATNELFKSGIDKPAINIKIDWIELSKTNEYKNFSNLERVDLGDTITIDLLGLLYKTRVIKTVYNPLNGRITSFELGSPKANIGTVQNEVQSQLKKLPTSILESAINNATEMLTKAMGGYVYKTQNELFIMDTNDVKTAKKIWRWNLNGLGYSKNGIDGPYETAITQDGKIVADFITTGKLNTSVIEGFDSLVTQVSNNTNKFDDYYEKKLVDILVQSSATGLTNTFSEAGGNNIFKNTGLWYKEENQTSNQELTGYPLEITNDSDTKLNKLVIEGRSEQEDSSNSEIKTVKGIRNLLNSLGTYNSSESKTMAGITYTFNEDGSISIKGKATDTTYVNLLGTNLSTTEDNLKIDVDYVCSGWSNENITLFGRGKNGSYYRIFNPKSTNLSDIKGVMLSAVYIQVTTGATVDETIYPMLEKGSIVHPYVPFGNWLKIIFKCEVQEKHILIKMDKVNLFTGELEVGNLSDTGEVVVSTQTIRSKDYIEVKASKGYSLKTVENEKIVVYFYDSNYANLGFSGSQDAGSNYFTTPVNTKYIKFRTNPVYHVTNNINEKFVLYEGIDENDYFELASVDTIKDTLTIENNKAILKKRVGKSDNSYVALEQEETYELEMTGNLELLIGINALTLNSDLKTNITATITTTNAFEFWSGQVRRKKNDNAANYTSLLLQKGMLSQNQNVPNGNYCVSFKYKKLIEVANVRVFINEIEYELDSLQEKEFQTGIKNEDDIYITQPLIVSSRHIEVDFITDINNSCEVWDLMVNAGTVKLAYSQNQNETTTDTVNISKGITIESSANAAKLKANSDGIRILNKNTNEITTDFTDDGITTNEITVKNKATICGTLVQDTGEQTWLNRL